MDYCYVYNILWNDKMHVRPRNPSVFIPLRVTVTANNNNANNNNENNNTNSYIWLSY